MHETETGLAACGRCGQWSIDIDEALAGPEKWFAQFEYQCVYLYFELASSNTPRELFEFLNETKGNPQYLDVEIFPGRFQTMPEKSLVLGTLFEQTVKIIKDGEFDVRYFLVTVANDSQGFRLRIRDQSLVDFQKSLGQVLEDLADC